ncbi:uncharacterized protein LOC141708647 [Apium graveolens]|uniref:uncharacterized protein LOC141708647 n=1 Tax=Apium graveolens TaxID=4045 RepID=UPI003D7B547F
MGGEEVMPLDISSDEEEIKPQLDNLSLLVSLSKPHSRIETSEQNLKTLMAAAVVLKDELVKHLVKTCHKLDIADMELKEVNEKNTCPDLELKVAYEKSMSDVNAAKEELANAERNLIKAQTEYELTMQRIEKLITMTQRLKEEADKEKNGITNLETKRHHCHEVLSLAEKSKDQYEKIQRALG